MNIEKLRKLCLSFPNVTEDVKWGNDLCFSIGEKMFCITGADQSNSQISFKCTPEKFAELVEREGIVPAPRVARYHWVSVEDPQVLGDEEYEDLISKSFLLVFEKLPASLRATLGSK